MSCNLLFSLFTPFEHVKIVFILYVREGIPLCDYTRVYLSSPCWWTLAIINSVELNNVMSFHIHEYINPWKWNFWVKGESLVIWIDTVESRSRGIYIPTSSLWECLFPPIHSNGMIVKYFDLCKPASWKKNYISVGFFNVKFDKFWLNVCKLLPQSR